MSRRRIIVIICVAVLFIVFAFLASKSTGIVENFQNPAG